MSIKECKVPSYADIVNLLASIFYPPESIIQQRKKLLHDSRAFIWDEPYLFKICEDGNIRRCIPEEEIMSILDACHSSPVGGHHGGAHMAYTIL